MILLFLLLKMQDPFYNQDMFIFTGATYFTTAVLFASRYRMGDFASSYDIELLLHPNSGCPGSDHLRWSIFFQPQFVRYIDLLVLSSKLSFQ